MFYPKERVTVIQAQVLPPAATTTISSVLPLDRCGWYSLRLCFTAVLAAVLTPFADGIYRFIKGITIRTSRGEVLLNNVPGMALYRMNQILYGKSPYHQEHLAAGGTFTGVLDIPFTFPFLKRKEDTIVDTGRYSNIEIQITTGALAVFAPAAPATCPVTMGLEIERTLSPFAKDGKSKPLALPYITTYPCIATAVTLQYDLESALDLGLFGFFLYNHDVLLIEGAVPFCSPAAGGVDHLAQVTLRDSVRTWIDRVQMESFQKEREDLLSYDQYDGTALPVAATEIPTNMIGLYPYLFVKNGSINEVYATGKKSLIQLSFTLNAAAGTERASLCAFGMRALR